MISETGLLARAFAIVGFQGDRLSNAVEVNATTTTDLVVTPTINFIYPNEDGDDTVMVLDSIIETRFSRPQGYQVLDVPKQPDFHTIRLTDRQCRVTYVSVLTFYESFIVHKDTSGLDCGTVFVPKFLVIISDVQFSDLFRNCLRSIYEKVALEGADVDCLNRAIANLVHCKLPAAGQISQLNLGFGEVLTVHTPSAKSVPKTGLTVYRLVNVLGPENTAKAFFCLLSQLQVTMYSADVSFLTDSCEALLALLYPFEYYFIYAPVQTKRCLERHKTLENPTPFFIGICEPPEDVLADVLDKVVLIDLDRNVIKLPSSLPDEFNDVDKRLSSQLVDDLRAVTHSKEYQIDQRAPEMNLSRGNSIEKRLRACFLKFHASLICDYRQSLCAVRMHPNPKIFFDKAHFFGRRRLRYQPHGQAAHHSSFLSSFVDIFLEQILRDRKLPVREADFFDELCALLCGMTGEMIDSVQLVEDIAKYLMENDKLAVSDSCPPSVAARYLASRRTLPFPSPNRTRIAKYSYEMNYEINTTLSNSMVVISPIKRNSPDNTLHNSPSNNATPTPSPSKTGSANRHGRIMAGARHRYQTACCGTFLINQVEDRVAIYSAYIACIFARELKKAKTLVPNLPKSLESDSAEVRRRIPIKLYQYCQTLTQVDSKQFWALAQIVQSLLALESPWDENFIAASLLPVLRNIQMVETKRFLYTTVQRLPVWRNELFWVSLACRHIAADLSARYESRTEIDLDNEPCHSVDVLAKIMEKGQPSRPIDAASEEAIAMTWCKHFTDLMIAFLIDYDRFESHHADHSGQEIGIEQVDDCYFLSLRGENHRAHGVSTPSVEYHVSYAVEEICKEANILPSNLESMKAEIWDKINEHVRYVENLQTRRQSHPSISSVDSLSTAASSSSNHHKSKIIPSLALCVKTN